MERRKLLIAGNWKMNGEKAFTENFLHFLVKKMHEIDNEIAVFPPFVYLPIAKEILNHSPIQLGAQDVSAHERGAYTGEVSAFMLKEIGCTFVIVGHSERRAFHHESNALAAKKCVAACQHQLTPILCLGETQSEKDEGLTQQVITKQLLPLLEFPGTLQQTVLAYEPVWAIGTGKTATTAEAQAAHHFIRQIIAKKDPSLAHKIRILYGGSLKADNAAELFSMPDIDGGLIGGASLKEEEFLRLCLMSRK